MIRRFVRIAALVLAISVIATQPADARRHHHYQADYSDSYYTNSYGHRVHRPTHSYGRPAGASARCSDGTWSFSEHHSGTCSHHGGVSQWLR